MFGVTTPCVTRARERLEELGYEVLVFHATGTGGQPSSRWPPAATWSARSTSRRPSWPTTSSAASSRPAPTGLRPSARTGIPQVVSLGALDMVNFGPRDTVPERFEGRNLYVHNPTSR